KKLTQQHPEQREMLLTKYHDFMRRYKKSPLVAKAKEEIKKLKSREAVEYEKLVKKVHRIMKRSPKYGFPLAEDHINRYIQRYRGTPWAEKAKKLKESLKQQYLAKKNDSSDSEQNSHEDGGKENGKEEPSLTEREKLQKYLVKATQFAQDFDYEEARKELERGSQEKWTKKELTQQLQFAMQDMDEEETFWQEIIRLLNEKKDRLYVYLKRIRRTVVKVEKKGWILDNQHILPWKQVPLLFFERMLKWKNWTKKEYYPLGLFLSTHHLSTLGYRFFKKALKTQKELQKRVESFVGRLENRLISETGFRLYRDNWVRGMDYQQLSRNKVYYIEGWYDKKELLKRYGQSLAEKLKMDQEKEAKKALKERREKLFREYGVLEMDTMLDQGDPSKNVDVVIMCDGFRKDQIPYFRQLASTILLQLKVVEPFKSYKDHINVHRIDLYEQKEGIKAKSEKTAKTRLGCYINELDQLKCNRSRVNFYSSLAPDADMVIVVANTKDVRPTGGDGLLVIDIGGDFAKRVATGIGFAFGNLSVEYVDLKMVPHYPDFGPEKEPYYYNVTRESNPKKVKWHYWNYPPTSSPKVGCYEGAYYRDKGYYKPTEKCRMISSQFENYCVVCLEQLERAFYKFLSPIGEFLPILPQAYLFRDQKKVYEIKFLKIRNMDQVGGKYESQWYIDQNRTKKGKQTHDGTKLVLYGRSLKPGIHHIAVQVRYSNKRVRRDLGVMEDHRVWTLEVLPFDRPKIRGPKEIRHRSGKLLEFYLNASPPYKNSDFEWKLQNPPKRAVFDPQESYFQWCPGDFQRGAYILNFEISFKKRPDVKIIYPVKVTIYGPGDNNLPFFRYQKPIIVQEGEEMEQKILAFDVDGDHLLYSIKKGEVPPGLKLDENEGVLHWRPTFFQGGTYKFKIRVTDGERGRTLPLIIKVENKNPTEKEKYKRDFGIYLGLRSANPKIKANAMKQLSKWPPMLQWMKWVNYLRDFQPKIRERAYQVLSAWMEKGTMKQRLLFLQLVEPYVFQLMDEPKTMRLIRSSIAKVKKSRVRPYPKYCKSIEKWLKKIDKYNEWRFKEDLKKK
ncbi:MAG: hypothetical protein D6785_10020, partial [Planctomycetota bacterium]